MLGAFAAHGLEGNLDAKMLQRFHTGVEYQFYHSLALLLTVLLDRGNNLRVTRYAAYAFTAGILLFSGSLYAYVLTGVKAIAMITPLGGLAFILGWGMLVFLSIKSTSSIKI